MIESDFNHEIQTLTERNFGTWIDPTGVILLRHTKSVLVNYMVNFLRVTAI